MCGDREDKVEREATKGVTFIPSFNKYLLSVGRIVSTVLGAEATVVNKTKIPALIEHTF